MWLVLRVAKVAFYLLVFMLISGAVLLFLTPFGYKVRVTAAEMTLSSQHTWLTKFLLLPENEVVTLTKDIYNPRYVNTDPSTVTVKQKVTDDISQIMTNIDAIMTGQPTTSVNSPVLRVDVQDIYKYYNPAYYYRGKIMMISDPADVKLVCSRLKNWGQQINILASENKAIGAINAGGFNDPNGNGNGGTPSGLVIEDGMIKHSPEAGENEKSYVAGLTESGELITGYFSPSELLSFGVTSAAAFRPELIANGQKITMAGDGGWGIGPRTAIGQKSDGTIIFLEIDGRQPGYSIGATVREVQDVMFKLGAVNATCMDGGSSSIMYFNGQNITTPSSVGHIPRWLPNVWVVVPAPGQQVILTDNGESIREH